MDVNLEGRCSCQLFVLVLEVAIDEHESIVQTLELAGDVERHAVLDETSEAICMFLHTAERVQETTDKTTTMLTYPDHRGSSKLT